MTSTSPRRIVLTGVTRGLGLAMAQQFVELGHVVLGCGRSTDDLARLRQRFGAPHDFAAVDVTQTEQVHQWAKRLLAAHGAPVLLLNNAAVMTGKSVLWEETPAEFDRLIDINVKGVA